jgi:hypothetical protein
MMTGELSDEAFARRALEHVPAERPGAGFEAALLAAYDGWNARRAEGPLARLTGALRGLHDLIWPGAPRWALAGAFTISLAAGVALGALLPAPGEEGMAFSLERTPGFNLLPSDTDEDL